MKGKFSFALVIILLFSCEPEAPAPSGVQPPPTAQPAPPETEPNASYPILVHEVFPLKNDIGDTITFNGENFSRDIILLLGSNNYRPVFVNDTVIKFEIPFGNYDPFDFNLTIKNEPENQLVLHNPFELYAPVIDSIPGTSGFTETFTLFGKHLTNYPNSTYNILYLDDQHVDVSKHSKDSIVFTLPWNLQKYEYDVLVRAQLQEVRKSGGLKINAPQLHSISKTEVEIGETLTIYGSYFSPAISGFHHVYIQGNRAEVLEVYKDSLIVKIPMGPYKSRKISEIKLILFEKEVELNVDLNLTSKWYMYGYKRNGQISNAAGVGQISDWGFWANEAYYFNVYRQFNNSGLINNILYRYTPETDIWEEIIVPIQPIDPYDIHLMQFFPLEGTSKVFIYMDQPENNFYEYDVITNEVTPLKDLNTQNSLHSPTGFFANGNFYIGLGYYSTPSQLPNQKFWKYSRGMNSWTETSSMPDVKTEWPRVGTSVFKNGNSVLVGNGHEEAYDFWQFSPGEVWTRKSDVQNPSSGVVEVQIGKIGFYYDYLRQNFWEYDLLSDIWKKREDLQIKGYPYGSETMFIHNNYVYFVAYLTDYGPDGTPYFSRDHIILRTELSNF